MLDVKRIIELLEENGYEVADILQLYIPNASFALVELALIIQPVMVDVCNNLVKEIDIDFVEYVQKCND